MTYIYTAPSQSWSLDLFLNKCMGGLISYIPQGRSFLPSSTAFSSQTTELSLAKDQIAFARQMTNCLAQFTKDDQIKERCILFFGTGYHRQPTDESDMQTSHIANNIAHEWDTAHAILRLDAYDIRGP